MDVTTLTDTELDQLVLDVQSERQRRSNLATIPETIDLLNRTYLADDGVVPGEDWRQPTGAHDAYPLDWQVVYNGKTWVSLTSANVWAPGVSSWREVVPPQAPPAEWVQPTGSQDAYNKGARVTFQGQIYESLLDANTWSPTAYPQGWKLITA